MGRNARFIHMVDGERKVFFNPDATSPKRARGTNSLTYYLIDETNQQEDCFCFGPDGNLLLVYSADQTETDVTKGYLSGVKFVRRIAADGKIRHIHSISEPFNPNSVEHVLRRTKGYDLAKALLDHIYRTDCPALDCEVGALGIITKYGRQNNFGMLH
jgi:hypothetical protein